MNQNAKKPNGLQGFSTLSFNIITSGLMFAVFGLVLLVDGVVKGRASVIITGVVMLIVGPSLCLVLQRWWNAFMTRNRS